MRIGKMKRKKAMLAVLLLVAAVVLIFFSRDRLAPPVKAPEEVTILGPAEVSPAKMAAYIKERNPAAKLNCSIDELVAAYYAEAGAEGVRPDLALCQAIKETGCFAYGGDVVPEQNNYCGLGTTGKGVKGHFFATPEEGVRAHIQHLLAYASEQPPKKALVDPRYNLVKEKHPEIFGQVRTWVALNGKWAVPGTHYGQDIVRMLDGIRQAK